MKVLYQSFENHSWQNYDQPHLRFSLSFDVWSFSTRGKHAKSQILHSMNSERADNWNLLGSSRYPYHENSSSDSEEEILRRLKLQQSISLQSGQIAKYGGFNSPLNQSIHLEGFQPIPTGDNGAPTSTKPIRYSSSRTSSLYNNGHRLPGSGNTRDLLGQAERGKIGSHTSSECSSNSSVEASVESNVGLINHEKKGDDDDQKIWPFELKIFFRRPKTNKPNPRQSGTAARLENRATEQRQQRAEIEHHSPRQSRRCSRHKRRKSRRELSTKQRFEFFLDNFALQCIVDVQEPLFDTSDLKSLKSELDLNPQSPTASLLGRGGNSSLEIALLYDAPMRKMTVHVLQARGIPSREKTTTHTQVRLLILPSKKQKHKTKIRSGENPQFMERWGDTSHDFQFAN